jgi:hypothetical protein
VLFADIGDYEIWSGNSITGVQVDIAVSEYWDEDNDFSLRYLFGIVMSRVFHDPVEPRFTPRLLIEWLFALCLAAPRE